MHYLNCKILILLLIISCSACLADNTIIIKKYKKPSRALLNKKIIYMDMGQAPQTQANQTKGISNLANPVTKTTSKQTQSLPQKKYKVKSLNKKSFAVNKLQKKSKLVSIGRGIEKESSSIGEYNDDDWGEYTEYREVEMQESLGVSARIKR